MVGVPRSRGCRLCVQRRVRCDGARPTCNNCRKGNRPCPGYGPGVKFQDEGPKLREKYNKDSSSSSPENESEEHQVPQTIALRSHPISPRHPLFSTDQQVGSVLGWDLEGDDMPSQVDLLGFVEGKTQKYLNIDLFDAMCRFGPPAGTIPGSPTTIAASIAPGISTTVFSPNTTQIQLLSQFASSIAAPDPGFLPKSMRNQKRWLSNLPPLTGTNLLLDTAVRAVTLVHIGRLHANETFIMESRPLYGKALRLLNTAIVDPEKGMSNKTLCATILLSFYEMFSADKDASWIRHAGGAGTLMRLRGAARHRYGFDRDIFLSYRHTLVIEAFWNDTPSFLDEPEWKTLAVDIYADLMKEGDIPADRQEIFWDAEQMQRQMASISVVVANASDLWKGRTPTVEDRHLMMERLQVAYRDLRDLCINFDTKLNKSNYASIPLPSNDPVMPTQYHFTNVFLASYFVGFRTTLMLIHSHMEPLAESLNMDTTSIKAEDREYALDSCRCVEYMLVSSFLGPFFTIFALRFALRIFRADEIERDWVLCKLFEIGDRRMQFAMDIPDYTETNYTEPLTSVVAKAQRRLEEYRSAYMSAQSMDIPHTATASRQP